MKPTSSSSSARVSKPLVSVAVLLSAFVLVNALVVGCGGASKSGSEGTSESSDSQMADQSAGGQMADQSGGEAASGVDAEIAAGKQIYSEKCVLCHGATGHGDGPGAAALDPKPRNHTDGEYMNARTNAELHEVIKNGKGQMPAWGSQLSDEQIDQVLSYVRTLAVPKYTGPMP